jgi:hypothetical protein
MPLVAALLQWVNGMIAVGPSVMDSLALGEVVVAV